MKVGENCYGDENEWQQVMEDHTAEDPTRQEMVHEARDKELAKAAVEEEEYTCGDSPRGTDEISGAGKGIWKGTADVVRAAIHGEQDTAGEHGTTGGTHDGTKTGDRGALATARGAKHCGSAREGALR
jgi:hypothetical protein